MSEKNGKRHNKIHYRRDLKEEENRKIDYQLVLVPLSKIQWSSKAKARYKKFSSVGE